MFYHNIDLETDDKGQYYFFPIPSSIKRIQFRVQANKDAQIVLSKVAALSNPLHEIIVGTSNNTQSIIRKNFRTVTAETTPGFLNQSKLRGFWIDWSEGVLNIGKERVRAEDKEIPFLSLNDKEASNYEYIGFCTGLGTSGTWLIQLPSTASPEKLTMQPIITGNTATEMWAKSSNGKVPQYAFVGGVEGGQPVFVIRVNDRRGLIPGKLVRNQDRSYISWGGEVVASREYEVLCEFYGNWRAISGDDEIPLNALSAGETAEGETLYIGKVLYNNEELIGKVDKKFCHVVYDRKELSFYNYQILTK